MNQYALLYALSVLVTFAGGVIGLIQAADPTTLGFSPLASRWLGIVGGALLLAAGFLPRVTKFPSDDRKGMD